MVLVFCVGEFSTDVLDLGSVEGCLLKESWKEVVQGDAVCILLIRWL